MKKSNQLVNARFDFTVLEIRLFTLMISQITNDDEDFATYRIPIQEFIKTFSIKNKNIYKELERTTDSLIKKIIKIPIEEWGQKKLFKTSLVNSFKYNVDGTGVIEATFHPDLKPYLLQLKNRFLMYDMKHVLNISSSNSIRMYELLKAFEWIGKRTFDVDDLKEILGVEEKYNNRYYNFKKRVILQAQKDITEHTDITFTFKELKKPGTKKVGKITFYISPKKGAKTKEAQPKAHDQNGLFEGAAPQTKDSPVREKHLQKYKFSQAILNHIAATYEDEYVLQTIRHCESYFQSTNVPNPEGFIIKALEKRYYEDQIQESKEKRQKREQQVEKDTSKEEQEAEFQRHLQNLVEERLSALPEEERGELKNAFLSKMEGNSFFKTALGAYGFEHNLIQGQWKVFLREKLLSDEERDFDVFMWN